MAEKAGLMKLSLEMKSGPVIRTDWIRFTGEDYSTIGEQAGDALQAIIDNYSVRGKQLESETNKALALADSIRAKLAAKEEALEVAISQNAETSKRLGEALKEIEKLSKPKKKPAAKKTEE